MKKLSFIVPILLILAIVPAFADISYKMNAFTGGSLDLNIGFNSDGLYGARGDALRMGGAMSTLDFNPSFTSYNPACLAFLNTSVASMDLIPVPVLSSRIVEKFLPKDAGTLIKDAVNDGPFKDGFKDFNPQPGVETKIGSVGAVMEQQSGFTGFEIMVPFAKNQASIAFARESKLSLDANLLQNGFSTSISLADSAAPTIDLVSLTVNADSSGQIHMDNIVTSIGIGRKFTPEWGVGAVLEHYDSDVKGNARVNITATADNLSTGSMGIGDLNQLGFINLYGEGWGLRFGTSYHLLKDTIDFGADFSIEPEITYAGSATFIGNSIVGNVSASDTNVNTTPNNYTENGILKIKLPSFMRLSFGYKAGMVLNVNYTHYFDSFSMKYAGATADKSGEYYVNMMDDIRLGLNFGYFQLGGGAIYTRIYSKQKGEEKTVAWTAIPALSVGMVIPAGDYLRYELLFIATPLPAVKSAVTYYF